jgi:hypothetical protein
MVVILDGKEEGRSARLEQTDLPGWLVVGVVIEGVIHMPERFRQRER